MHGCIHRLSKFNKQTVNYLIFFFGFREFIIKMDGKTDNNLDRFEKRAILEAEKRKKPGECLKVNNSSNILSYLYA